MSAGLIIDLFAGGGGASTGIEAALGRPVDIAINHDAVALAAHKANHPRTRHLEADIWEVKPEAATGGRPVAVLWASPDCTHFSVAKGGKPRKKGIRSLAWAVTRWAKAVRPAVIFLENVAEFRGWGPLGPDNKPDKSRMGQTFRAWKRRLERLGYTVDYCILDASTYGAPTRRRRLFLIARCDGGPIAWPTPTHGPGRQPFHTAAECIDWSLECPSIFERKKPLADKTLWRIAQGIRRFVIDNPTPFIVNLSHGGRTEPLGEPLRTITATPKGGDRALIAPSLIKVNHGKLEARGESLEAPLTTVTASRRGHALIAPTLIQTGYGERAGQKPRALDLAQPLGTVVAGGQKHALIAAFVAKHFGDRAGGFVGGQRLDQPTGTVTTKDHHALTAATLVKLRGQNHGAQIELPLPTITAGGNHLAEVSAFLVSYYTGGSVGQSPAKPMRTVTTKDRLGLITVRGVDYQIVDIGMRMLQPDELARAQFGRFAAAYDLSAATTKSAKVRLIGNSVCPEVAEAIVRANVPTPMRVAA